MAAFEKDEYSLEIDSFVYVQRKMPMSDLYLDIKLIGQVFLWIQKLIYPESSCDSHTHIHSFECYSFALSEDSSIHRTHSVALSVFS